MTKPSHAHQCLKPTRIFLRSSTSPVPVAASVGDKPSPASISDTTLRFSPSLTGIFSSASEPLKYFVNAGQYFLSSTLSSSERSRAEYFAVRRVSPMCSRYFDSSDDARCGFMIRHAMLSSTWRRLSFRMSSPLLPGRLTTLGRWWFADDCSSSPSSSLFLAFCSASSASSSSSFSFTARLVSGSTLTNANVLSCVTHPPLISHARISMYASLWSALGKKLPQGRGVPLRALSIFGKLGRVEN